MPHANQDALAAFHPVARRWFTDALGSPTSAQREGWRAIADGRSSLIQAPTGSGKTLAAFFWALDRLMFGDVPVPSARCRVLYVSPLKALAVDVERNLRVPLSGMAALADTKGVPCHQPAVAVRTGDTPQAERARFKRAPADILITTPESLYLLLTSDARLALRPVTTVIIDEVHALVPTKRGAHLALSLERLEHLCGRPLQRIGLSATQRPLEEVAHYLGGARAVTPRRRAATSRRGKGGESELREEFTDARRSPVYRPVTIVNTGERKQLDLRIDVPVDDMAKLAPPAAGEKRSKEVPGRVSIWTAIYPRLLELIRSHRSTLLFVNSRRGAERLAGALNELAGEALVRAHHGSLAREQRTVVEEALKAGRLRGLVATSSLELGIDMGAIDLVLQIEAPPSVAAGLQRVGRGGHHVDAVSRAVVFPKFRSDLLACAAVTRAMRDGRVEATRYPRNPLDVLAQQVVAMCSVDPWKDDELFATVRQAAPFAAMSRAMFDGVLDMLSGRYPSDDFAELKPRITWDRTGGTVTAREGAKRVAVVSGGTIPDRGLYGVFMTRASPGAARVGELDEEMVFESRVGETFVLGATTWRIDDITHDRVLVSPAPGEPGKMPFWKADSPGRPVEFGLAIGALTRQLREMPPAAGRRHLTSQHDLDARAAENLLRYLADQAAATGVVPDDRTIVIERCRDEMGDWRVCVLSPLGSRVHGPWAMAVAARVRTERGLDVETMWTDDGFVARFPELDEAPDPSLLLPSSAEVEHLVVSQLGATAHFAARFREAAGRALLLPRRRPGQRSPLWLQRKRASDLLAVASRYNSFPMVLEAYRECLRDDFDIPAVVDVMRRIERRAVRTVTVDTSTPSPFAASLLFGYVANYLYDGDAPLAERRAQALAIDLGHLRDLIGTADLRELLDSGALDALELELQRADGARPARSADAVHDLLLHLGDLSRDELLARAGSAADVWLGELQTAGRIVELVIAADRRLVAVEHAAQYRDALGVRLPKGIPAALLASAPTPLDDVVGRFARTRGPFTTAALAERYAWPHEKANEALVQLAGRGKLTEGQFRPGATGNEWCSPDVLSMARRRSRAALRHEAAPVEPAVLGRFLPRWQGIGSDRSGPDALLDAIESLQGAALPASALEAAILPARIADYDPSDLDTLAAAGEIVWAGVESLGQRDGRVALYLTDRLPVLAPVPAPGVEARLEGRERAVLDVLRQRGASFFGPLHDAVGGGYPGETVAALWALVWLGLVTNDSFQALRSYLRPPARARAERPTGRPFRSRRESPPSSEGRWAALRTPGTRVPPPTERAAALADQLLARYGILTRDAATLESVPGGFSAIYPVLRALEDAGRVRRGYFVAGVAATQFARATAVDLLRAARTPGAQPDVHVLAATDPANPYGHLLPWPSVDERAGGAPPFFARAAGASVVLVDGALTAFWRARSTDIGVCLPPDEPERSTAAAALAHELARLAGDSDHHPEGLLITTVNGRAADAHPLAPFLGRIGFRKSALGYHVVRPGQRPTPATSSRQDGGEEDSC